VFSVNGPILILGRARSGEAVHELLTFLYPELEIFFYDDVISKSDFKNQEEVLQKKWSHAIISPGVPNSSFVDELVNQGVCLLQEMDVAAAFLTDEKVYAITGSVGKSTCAWVAYQALSSLHKKVFIGGNFGVPFIQYILNLKKYNREKAEYLIIEMSSYQIERMAFMIDRGLILNLHPNHLDRYKNLEAYYLAKLRMLDFAREGVWGIQPGGDLEHFTQKCGFATRLRWIDPSNFLNLFKHSQLLGEHNRANLVALLQFLASADLDEAEVIDALNLAEALPHRVELFTHKNSFFVNDSKATTVESVLSAYEALRERFPEQTLIWLLGGRDKNLPWTKLKRLWSDQNLELVFFGEAGTLIKDVTGLKGEVAQNLKEALSSIQKRFHEKTLLVLSPGGTSLDEFKSFEERGDFFKSFIQQNF
jgi:UDP-N-acetylmuramoylalanine--D-glutamate ligase